MRRMYISSLFRREGEKVMEGKLYALDWSTKTLLWEIETQSARGICFYDGDLLAAIQNNDIYRIDVKHGEILHKWNYPTLEALHRIYVFEDKLWLPSTGNDSLGLINLQSMRLESLTRMAALGDEDNTLHFNSLGWDGVGNRYHLYHHLGQLFRCTDATVVAENLYRAHDVEFIDDFKAIVNHSIERSTLLIDVVTGERTTILTVPDGPSSTVAQWGWTRGIAIYNKDCVFVGSSPVDVHMLNPNRGWVEEDWFRVSDTLEECIFDIQLDPRDWA